MRLKKLCALLLAVVLTMGLCSCGTSKDEKADANNRTTFGKIKAGDYISFGSYPQTSSGDDNTPIEWLVLESDEETALLISRYALDCKQYNEKFEDTTWETCTLRDWLNNEFFNKAFGAEEKQSILQSDVSADKNPEEISTNPGNATKDNVFLLSVVETNKYFKSKDARRCAPTDYAIKRGARTSDDSNVEGRNACWWWLRSPGYNSCHAAYVYADGSIPNDYVDYSNNVVRPCVRVRLSSRETNQEERQDEADADVKDTSREKNQFTVGSYVTFGSYPQSEAGNDETPIEWLVLDCDGETALLISRYALDCMPYNKKKEDITWETCTLRGWLNNEFFNKAFSAEEKQYILQSDVSADKNPEYSTNPGNATKDNVFLLSVVETNKYFKSDDARICAPTDYAIQQGANTSDNKKIEGRDTCGWWLRSPGYSSFYAAHSRYYAAYVRDGGSINDYFVNWSRYAVRPCVRVRLF